jgi:hypothetical protein
MTYKLPNSLGYFDNYSSIPMSKVMPTCTVG